MQNRIDKLFIEKKINILSLFVTAGFPKLNDTLEIIKCIEDSGADMIEIGIPFSDPLADGETIQKSSLAAIQNGMTLNLVFEQLKNVRQITQKPILVMGYLNSFLQYGIEKLYESCSLCGIDGVIIPDLPISEFESEHKPFATKYNIKTVFLISPETSEERIIEIDKSCSGFIYLVSSNSTTGNKATSFEALKVTTKKIKTLNIKNPILIGFGIKDTQSFASACELANGAIIGSEFIRQIENSKSLKKDIKEFINLIKNKENDYSIK